VDTIYQISQTPQFVKWLKSLKDIRAKAAIVLRLKNIEAGNLGDFKQLENSVAELRFHIGPGYRVYFSRRNQKLILLLAGGDKSTQAKDIARALKLAKEYVDEQDH